MMTRALAPAAEVPDPEKVRRGIELVREGWIKKFRETAGLSRNHVGAYLGSHGNHVKRWEKGIGDDGGVLWVHWRSAVRIAELHDAFGAAEEWLEYEKIHWYAVTPLRVAAYQMGIAPSTLRSRLATLGIEPIDFGMMGQWILKEEVQQCRR